MTLPRCNIQYILKDSFCTALTKLPVSLFILLTILCTDKEAERSLTLVTVPGLSKDIQRHELQPSTYRVAHRIRHLEWTISLVTADDHF